MRRAVFVCVFLALFALLAAPAAAQTQEGAWLFNAQVGPAFGTLGTRPSFDAKVGYAFTDQISFVGEFGGISHVPFEKATDLLPSAAPLANQSEPNVRVHGYHYNGNLMIKPPYLGPVTPYATLGIGAFTGSAVADDGVGPAWLREYERETHYATNLGGGISYRVNQWLGLNADYRTFMVVPARAGRGAGTTYVNRFTTGVSLFVD
jgi:hypothetical protein